MSYITNLICFGLAIFLTICMVCMCIYCVYSDGIIVSIGGMRICLSCEGSDPTEALPLTGDVAGADFGMKTFLTLSDGTKIASPEFYKQSLNAIRSTHKALSRKQYLFEGMKRLWGRKISDLAFGEFALILDWVCRKYGKMLAKAGQWQPTTKVCHVCQHKNASIRLSDRYWRCPSCGTHHDRDINAAKVILQVGVAVS